MLCAVARSIDPEAFLALGYLPTEGTDESFPGGFTIRAEKAPNRRGVEAVLGIFGAATDGVIPGWNELVAHVQAGQCKAAWVTAGPPHTDDLVVRRGNRRCV